MDFLKTLLQKFNHQFLIALIINQFFFVCLKSNLDLPKNSSHMIELFFIATQHSVTNFYLPQSMTEIFQLPNSVTKGNWKLLVI
jgi:hypothetical protein